MSRSAYVDLPLDIQHILILIGAWLAHFFYRNLRGTAKWTAETSSTEWQEVKSGRHPLLIPPIMECVLRHLNTNDLKTCRLACTTWNTLSMSILKKKTAISLSEEALTSFLSKNSNLLDFQNFSMKFQLSQLPLIQEFFTNFGSQIHNFHVESFECESDKYPATISNKLDDFLEEHAQNNWRTLSLDFKSFRYTASTDSPAEIRTFKLNWCEKLTNLRVSEDWEDQEFIRAIFTRATSLQTLYMTCTKMSGMSYPILSSLMRNLLAEEEDARQVSPSSVTNGIPGVGRGIGLPGINLFGWDNEPDFSSVPMAVEFKADLKTLIPGVILRTNLSLLVITNTFLSGDVIFICTAFPPLNRIKIYLARLEGGQFQPLPLNNVNDMD